MADTSILIENPDIVRDIERLAARTGKPAVEAVAEAVRARLSGAPSGGPTRADKNAELRDILARIDALPQIGEPLTDADLYDEDGLPR
ncbi:MAG: type II toxin-antitoxin system VapB family antitoxin [Terricaulis sp.]